MFAGPLERAKFLVKFLVNRKDSLYAEMPVARIGGWAPEGVALLVDRRSISSSNVFRFRVSTVFFVRTATNRPHGDQVQS